jgi:hypothetical protein
VYTVTVSSGLPNLAADAELTENIEFQFQTQISEGADRQIWFNIENDNNCFRTDEIPAFRYYRGWNEKPLASFDIEVYSFVDEKGYIEALASRQREYYWCLADTDSLIDTNSMAKVSSFNVSNPEGFVLRLPESLKAGYYLADFKAEGLQRQSLFQVTDLSGYLAAGDKDSLVWLNDLRTGQPVSGANVSLHGTANSAVTDGRGVAVLSDIREFNPILNIASGNNRLIMSDYNYWG